MNTVTKDGKTLSYEKVIKNNKNTYFRIRNGHVIVTANKHFTDVKIKDFIYNNFDKFYDKINQNTEKSFTLFGKEYEINVIPAKVFRYEVFTDTINIYSGLNPEKSIIRLYYNEIKNAYEILKPKVDRIIGIYKLKSVPVKFKVYKSRYGCCNTKKREIFINVLMAKYDTIFLEYVLLHEYAHLIVPNHQKEFYKVMDNFMIDHKKVRKALKKMAL